MTTKGCNQKCLLIRMKVSRLVRRATKTGGLKEEVFKRDFTSLHAKEVLEPLAWVVLQAWVDIMLLGALGALVD